MKEFQILPSRRGVLYYIEGDGYYFQKQKIRGTRMYLRCHVESCPVRAVTHPCLKRPPTFSPLAHTHAPNLELPEVLRLRARILRRCENEMTFPRKIYSEEIAKVDRNVALQLPFSRISRTMYRKQKDFMDVSDYIHANEADKDENDSTVSHVLTHMMEKFNDSDVSEDDMERTEKRGRRLQRKPARDRNEREANNYPCISCEEQLQIVKADNEAVICVLCLNRSSTIACVPCGHLCICNQCKLRYTESTCPVCKVPLSPFVEVS